MYGHNIVVRLHGFFCTLYTIIYVRFLYPICTPYEIQKFQKKPKKAKKAKFTKKAKIIQNLAFCQILAFLENLRFFGKFWIFLDFGFLKQVCCLSFRRLHKDYIDREYMTQSR
jgi:hypothetical protein